MIEITIKKPLYGSFVYIRDTVLRQAVRRGNQIKITIPQGTMIHNASNWIKSGKRMEKIFKRPDEPMILWGNNVFKSETSKSEPKQTKLF